MKTISNVEKAREIAIEYEDLCVIDLEDVALQAMRWKDRQWINFICYLEKHRYIKYEIPFDLKTLHQKFCNEQ